MKSSATWRYCARVVKQSLLRIEFGQLQRSIHARRELGDLFVHRDALDRETLRGIGIAHRLKALDGLLAVTQTRVQIANRVGDGEVFVVMLADFFILSNGIL